MTIGDVYVLLRAKIEPGRIDSLSPQSRFKITELWYQPWVRMTHLDESFHISPFLNATHLGPIFFFSPLLLPLTLFPFTSHYELRCPHQPPRQGCRDRRQEPVLLPNQGWSRPNAEGKKNDRMNVNELVMEGLKLTCIFLSVW